MPAGSAARGFASDWQAVRGDGDIQFAPVEIPVPETPAWMQWLYQHVIGPLFELLGAAGRALGLSGAALAWLLLALVAAGLLLLAWRILAPPARLREAGEDHWSPDAADALGLLAEADRLAAEGRYDEATHLLLQRSVGQIREARPDLLEPSSTAREIAALPALSEGARRAFAVIAERVERSLFALRMLSAEDWQAARAAYADFALVAPAAGR